MIKHTGIIYNDFTGMLATQNSGFKVSIIADMTWALGSMTEPSNPRRAHFIK